MKEIKNEQKKEPVLKGIIQNRLFLYSIEASVSSKFKILLAYQAVIYFITAISLPNLSPLSINPKLEYNLCAPKFSG